MFSFGRFSLTPALSRKERENNFPLVCAVTMTAVDGPNAVLQKDWGLSMNRAIFSFERFSLTPALSRWERENNLPMVCAVMMTVVHGPNAALQKTGGFP
jgi:hypothetical protein